MSIIRNSLSQVLKKSSNIDLLEEIINLSTDYPEQLCYEIIGLLLYEKEKKNSEYLQTVLKLLHDNRIEWNHPSFDTFKEKQQEEDNFMTTPLNIEDGVVECVRCGSKKTFSIQKQTRSADEPMTTFCTCAICGKKWRQ